MRLSLLCIGLLFTNGCATSVLLHPETARKAAAVRPVHPERFGDHPEIITITNQAGCRLAGWLFFSVTNHGVIIVGDGNATGIAQTYEYNRHLLNQGLNVLVLSYQGFDGNDGDADIGSLYGDLKTFYEYCRRRFPHQPIGLMAESVSTSPFFCFASNHPEIKALAVEAMVNLKTVPFAKVNDWWLFYPLYPVTMAAACLVSAGVPQGLSVQKALRHSHEVPILFLHHPRDRVTPFRIARRIFNRYRGPKQWITLQKDLSWENHMTASYEAGTSAEVLKFFKAYLHESR